MTCRAYFKALLTCKLVVCLWPALPAVSSAQDTVFAAIGDFGDASVAEGEVAGLISGWRPDFIITLGDNRYGTLTYDQVIGQFYCPFLADAGSGAYCTGNAAAHNAFFPSTGNHDYSDGGGINEYLGYFTLPGTGIPSSLTSGTELYYDFVRGPVHFFVLDSDEARRNSANMAAQQTWLQAGLAASTAPWQFVLLHHAPYSSSSTHGSHPVLQWPYAAWGADAVLAGHDHTYERLEADGIPYFVNGLGGRSLYNFGTPLPESRFRYRDGYGAMRMSASESRVNFEFINTAGNIIESFTLLPDDGTSGETAVRIISGDDDVEESLVDGAMYLTSTDIELGDDPAFNGTQTEGLRFRGISVPAGATVQSARLEFTVDEIGSDPTFVTIRAQASDNAPAFSTTPGDLTGRALTSAFTSWNIAAWNTVGEVIASPDIGAVIQEVIDRGGWSSGNAIAIVVEGTGTRTAEAYDGSPGQAPLLRITWSGDPLVNRDPNAAFTVSTDGLAAAFTDQSADADGTVVSWAWDFGDGSQSSAQDPNHTYAADGTYTVTLTVTDDDGATDSTSTPVTVSEPLPQPPAAPSNLSASVQREGKGRNKIITAITLNWTDNSDNEDSFSLESCVEVRTGKGKNRSVTCNFSELTTLPADTTSYTVSPPETGIHYRIRARNAEGYSDYSNEVQT